MKYLFSYYLDWAVARTILRLPLPVLRWSARGGQRPVSVGGDAEGRGSRQLLVDVSIVFQDDARTGIQRVVRALYTQLYQSPPDGFTVHPVFATRKRGYRYAPHDFLEKRYRIREINAGSVRVARGDAFLSLDLTTHLLPLRFRQLWFWKWRGVRFYGFVYDLLPLKHPEWFDRKLACGFTQWIKVVGAFSDHIFCISKTVRDDVVQWFGGAGCADIDASKVSVIALGADIENSVPDMRHDAAFDGWMQSFPLDQAILMVGTIEPRKGHQAVLQAFDRLWADGAATPLVVVGRRGWKMDGFIDMMTSHPAYGRMLFWLEGASDSQLQMLYQRGRGLIMASQAEGLGLPLLEAVHAGMPVLARDIPVFRENESALVSFFRAPDTDGFAGEIMNWMNGLPENSVPLKVNTTWKDSGAMLRAHIK